MEDATLSSQDSVPFTVKTIAYLLHTRADGDAVAEEGKTRQREEPGVLRHQSFEDLLVAARGMGRHGGVEVWRYGGASSRRQEHCKKLALRVEKGASLTCTSASLPSWQAQDAKWKQCFVRTRRQSRASP